MVSSLLKAESSMDRNPAANEPVFEKITKFTVKSTISKILEAIDSSLAHNAMGFSVELYSLKLSALLELWKGGKSHMDLMMNLLSD